MPNPMLNAWIWRKNLVDTEPRVQRLYKVISRKGYVGASPTLTRGFVFPVSRKVNL